MNCLETPAVGIKKEKKKKLKFLFAKDLRLGDLGETYVHLPNVEGNCDRSVREQIADFPHLSGYPVSQWRRGT